MVHKPFDEQVLFDDAVDISAWTAAAHNSAAIIDLGSADPDEFKPGEIIIKVPGYNSAGAATLVINVCTKATSPPAIGESILETKAYSLAEVKANEELRIPLPSVGLLQYIMLIYTVGTAALTGGTLTAAIVK